MSDPTKPHNPYLILAASLVLPGAGHVIQGRAERGLVFLFFVIVLGWTTAKIMPDDASFVARHAGGFLIYGLSILDAYKTARVRWEIWKHHQRGGGPPSPP